MVPGCRVWCRVAVLTVTVTVSLFCACVLLSFMNVNAASRFSDRAKRITMQQALLPAEPTPKPRPYGYGVIVWTTLSLLPAIFIGRIGWVGMKVTDTALLGHVSSRALTASALSDLWTSATGVFIQGRVLNIFVGNAIGAGTPRVAGEWFQVALFVQVCIAVPVMGMWALTGPVLSATREPQDLAQDAAYFSFVLIAAIPARVIFSAMTQFLSAQRIVRPFAVASLAGLVLNLILGLVLVLGVPTGLGVRGLGFAACPVVTALVEWWQLGVLLAWTYVGALHRSAWPEGGWNGWSTYHVTRARVCAYLRLYLPAALSIASDFWRMSLVGTLAATLSPLDLAVFTASYRIMWLSLSLAGSLSSAIGIQLSQHLGARRTATARRTVASGLFLAVVTLVGVGSLIVSQPRALASLFSSDASVLDAFESARRPLALTTVSMNLAVVLEGLLMTTGRTRTVLAVGLVGSWVGQVPAVYLLLRCWRRSLSAVFMGVSVGYALLCALLGCALASLNWESIADEAAERARPAGPRMPAVQHVQQGHNLDQSQEPRPGEEAVPPASE